MTETKGEPCFSCGAMAQPSLGPIHRYMTSSPGCWAVYGEVLAREYGNPTFAARHRLTVDAYAVQHPGTPGPQSIQSVALHLVSLYLVLAKGQHLDFATRALKPLSEQKGTFHWLEPPANMGAVTVADVAKVENQAAHVAAVDAWAASAWQAWRAHHDQVRTWAQGLEA